MKKIALFLSVVACALAATLSAQAATTCSVAPNPAQVGSVVIFHVEGLSGRNYLRVSGSPYRVFELGNAKSADVPVVVDAESVLFEVVRDDESGNYQNKPSFFKCRAVLSINAPTQI